jgi:ketosteroid isomerase-like protein
VAALYTSDALFVTSTGVRLQGRAAVQDAYESLLPRMKSVRLNVERLVASGEVAFATMQLSYDVPLSTGGSYAPPEIVGVALRQHWGEGWQFASQMGGDLITLAKLNELHDGVTTGGDTLRVRVSDVSGAAVAGAMVAFDVLAGHGTIEPARAYTDAKGIAAVLFTGGTDAEPSVVQAAAARLPNEPVFFSVRAPVPARAGNANSEDPSRSGAAETGAAPKP